MGNYNPYIPQIVGQEWVAIRDESLVLNPFANTLERGYTFVLPVATRINNVRFYTNQWNPTFGSGMTFTANVYPAGQEASSGPIRSVVIPTSSVIVTGSGTSIFPTPSGTAPLSALYGSGDNLFLAWIMGNGAIEPIGMSIFFATNSYAQLLNGKRILGVDVLIGINVVNQGFEIDEIFQAIQVHLNNDTFGVNNADTFRLVDLVTNQTPASTQKIVRIHLGDANRYFGVGSGNTAGVHNIMTWTYPQLQRFEASAANRLQIQLDEGTGISAVLGPTVQIEYAALEVFFCEENRILTGSRIFNDDIPNRPLRDPMTLGMNAITVRNPTTLEENFNLPAGTYTVTISESNMGDNYYSALYRSTSSLNQVRQLYELPTMPGVQINLPYPLNEEIINTTMTKESTALIPQLTMHLSGGALVEYSHVYGQQSVGQVYGSQFVQQDIDDRFVGSSQLFPYVRYYARRFGNTSAPLTLRGPYPSSGLLLPGTSGNYASTPDTAVLDIVGDIDIRVDTTPNSWTPAAASALLSKWAGGGFRSYLLNLTTTGTIQLAWSADGGLSIARESTVSVPITVGRLSLRATLDVDNGAAGHTVTFYTGPTVDGPWTQLGTPVVTAGITSIFSSSSPVEIGSHTGGTASLLAGYVHGAQIYNGIAGTAVATPNFDIQPPGTTVFVDSVGRTWTINGTAAIVRGNNANNSVATITPTEFDALDEIIDGWKEVTLQFSNPPSMGTSVTPPVWTWVAPGVLAGERWEVLGATAPAVSGFSFQTSITPVFNQVPSGQRLYLGTYGYPVSGAAINEDWLPQWGPYVSGSTPDNASDATIIFSQYMPTVTGFAVNVTSQALTGIGLQCGIAPCGVPTALLYNQLSWGLPPNTGTALDLYNRIVSGGWGTATDGKVWQNTTGAENSVDGTYGIYTVSSGGDREGWVNVGGANQDITVTVLVDQFPTTFRHRIGIVARLTDNLNHYNAEMWYQSTGAVELWIRKRVAGTQTDLASVQIQNLGISPTAERKLRFQVSGTTLRAKLWGVDQPEPLWWQLEVTDTSLTTGNNAGVFARNDVTGNPQTQFKFADFQVGAPNTWFGYYELQRSDSVTDWKTIMKATNPSVTGFKDYEARTDTLTSYRIRGVNHYEFAGPWSNTVSVTIPSPGVSGGCFNNGEHVMMFTSNERQDGGINLAYSDAWESVVTESFNFAEAGFTQLQPMFERDFFVAFRPLERGGDQFTRTLLVNAAAISPPTLPGFQSLSNMAWASVSYVCVRDEDGNRWFATVNVPTGTVQNKRKLYMATINIVEVTETPSPVDP